MCCGDDEVGVVRLRLMAMVTPSTLKETRLVAVVVLEALVVV